MEKHLPNTQNLPPTTPMSAPLTAYVEIPPTAEPRHLEPVDPYKSDNAPELVSEEFKQEHDAKVNERVKEVVEYSLGGKKPDAIFAFSGGTAKKKRGGTVTEEEGGRWRSSSFSDLSEHGLATGGRVRVIATAHIAKAIPEVPIVTDSYNQKIPRGTVPTMAEVMKQELMRLGVDEDRITKEEESISTVTQLIEMVKMTVANNWKNVAVVGNYWHLPRTAVMFDSLETIVNYEDPQEAAKFAETLKTFRSMDVNVGGVCSEDVLSIAHPRYERYLNEVDQSAGLQKTIASEVNGLEALANGTYRVTLQPGDLDKKSN